jgi:hypothetical protein
VNARARQGIQGTIDDLANLLGHPVLIEDADHQPLWWSEQEAVDKTRIRTFLRRSIDPAARAMLRSLKVATASGPVRTPALPAIDMRARWCHPLRVGRTLVGYLWVVDDDENLSEQSRAAMVACARQAEAVLAGQLNEVDARLRRRDALLTRLRSAVDEQAAAELIELEGLGAQAKAVVLDRGRGRGWDLGDRLWALPDPLPGMVAASGTPLPLHQLALAVRRALVTRRVLAAGGQLDRPSYDALGVWRLVSAAPDDITPDDIHPGAGVLRNLPRSDLLKTAETVLQKGGDLTAASEVLRVHRTTLYYRIDRIAELTGVNLRGDARLSDLDIALKLLRYREVE